MTAGVRRPRSQPSKHTAQVAPNALLGARYASGQGRKDREGDWAGSPGPRAASKRANVVDAALDVDAAYTGQWGLARAVTEGLGAVVSWAALVVVTGVVVVDAAGELVELGLTVHGGRSPPGRSSRTSSRLGVLRQGRRSQTT